MRITFCGTGAGGTIGPDRGNASIHLSHRDSHLLLDSGPGFLERMTKAQLDPDLVTDVIFSHLHFDHAMGVVDLFCRLLGRTGPPVKVYGPRDTDSYIEAALGFARVNVTRPSMNPGQAPDRWVPSVRRAQPGIRQTLGSLAQSLV